MPLLMEDFLETVRGSRRHFLKHLDGVTEEQWLWKPYPECKSLRETLVHLLWVDRGVLISLETGKSPDYMAFYEEVIRETENWDIPSLLAGLDVSHQNVLDFFIKNHSETSLDTTISMWGHPGKLACQIAYLSSEDHYHAGQVAFIRMAIDPNWNYYGVIYS